MRTSWIAPTLFALSSILWLASPAFAHGNMKHVLGTVSAVDAAHVVVKTRDGQTESIVRDGRTKYFRGDTEAKPEDLAVGDRVVVHATQGDPPTAKTIKLAPRKGDAN
jgi:hypothetical protein